VLLTAGGAAIRIEGGAITLSGPGNVSFKAGMKVLTGGGSASASLKLPAQAECKGCFKAMSDAASSQSATAELG
jgi:type VI secretion system secreted protein VgrG